MNGKFFDELISGYPVLAPVKKEIASFSAALERIFEAGGRLYLCGNGGSAADCSHIEAELTKSFMQKAKVEKGFCQRVETFGLDGKKLADNLEASLPAYALPTRFAVNTAVANDVGDDLAFAQGVYALGRSGDALWAISTSGNSQSCIYAMQTALARGMTVFLLTGGDGGAAANFADYKICVPATETAKIQELHLPVYHAVCAAIEDIKR